MKLIHGLTPHAFGTLRALSGLKSIRYFSGDAAHELVGAGYAERDQDQLRVSKAGLKLLRRVYSANQVYFGASSTGPKGSGGRDARA